MDGIYVLVIDPIGQLNCHVIGCKTGVLTIQYHFDSEGDYRLGC